MVDDNATNRRILEETLGAGACGPTLSDSAAESAGPVGAGGCGRQPFALALIDVHMPNVDGYTLVEWMRAVRLWLGCGCWC